MKTNLATIERRRLLQAEAHEKARTELREVTEGVAETICLERSRGEVIDTPAQGRGERPKPAYRLTGLAWVATRTVEALDDVGLPIRDAKGEIVRERFLTREEAEAGERYAKLFYVAQSGCVRSCLDMMEIKGGGGYAPSEAKSWARHQLHKIRFNVFHGHPGLIGACDEICGNDKRPTQVRPDRQRAEALQQTLKIALGLIVAHKG